MEGGTEMFPGVTWVEWVFWLTSVIMAGVVGFRIGVCFTTELVMDRLRVVLGGDGLRRKGLLRS